MGFPVLMVLVLVLGIALMVTIAVLGYLAAKRRREEFAAFAAGKGWTWTREDDRWVTRFDGHPFGTGDDRTAENIVTGTYDGRGFEAFDYSYTTTSTSTDANGNTTTHRTTHGFSVIAIETGVGLPRLEVTPEHWLTRMVGRLTNRDIELESEEFNRAFTVTCPDRKFASDVLHPQMMEFLLGQRDLGWRFQDRALLTVREGSHSPAEVEARLATIDEILDRVPEFVWREVDAS
ncbi:MAG TPA: DUF3137 domain-containing protein [Marmoricola sp.]|nr:DUF3137 domain-containing protein [Marmoricola sp.]